MMRGRENNEVHGQLLALRRWCLGLTAALGIIALAGAGHSLAKFVCERVDVPDGKGAMAARLDADCLYLDKGKLLVGGTDIRAELTNLSESLAKQKHNSNWQSVNAWVVVRPAGRTDTQIADDLKAYGVGLDGIQVIESANLGAHSRPTYLSSPGAGLLAPRKFGKRVVGAWAQRLNAHDGPIVLLVSGSGDQVVLDCTAPRDGRCGLYLVSVLYVP
jgi:hypothetical protein